MEGWKLKKGDYRKISRSEREILDKFYKFKNSKKRTLYKYFFLLTIIDVIGRGEEINFKNIVRNSIRKYWGYIYLKSDRIVKLSKKRDTAIEEIFIEHISDDDALGCSIDELDRDKREKLFEKCEEVFDKYVIGAVYGDFDGEIYSFDKKEKILEMNPNYKKVIEKNKIFIKMLLRNELKIEVDRLNLE